MENKYIMPEIKVEKLEKKDILMSSGVEDFKSHIAEPGDWGDDPIIDPDDDIVW